MEFVLLGQVRITFDMVDAHSNVIFRILSMEMGKAVMINDQDCDVQLPSPVDEQPVSEGSALRAQQAVLFLSLIHVVRCVGQMSNVLRCPVIGLTTLETFERNFTACLATLPIQYHPKSEQYLEPYNLPPIICLQNARFAFHRHNLSPACPYETRLAAMDYCLSTALDTAHLISRCIQKNPPPTPAAGHGETANWRVLLATSTSTMICTHLCRCMLLLLFRGEYAAALACVRFSAAIGDSRLANCASGRYIAFFLGRLLEKLKFSNIGNMEKDEEMIAYMSGDMQGTIEGSWVWQSGGENSPPQQQEDGPSNVVSRRSSFQSHGGGGGGGGGAAATSEVWSSIEQEVDWQGWEWVERTVEYLLAEKQRRGQQEQQQQQLEKEELEKNLKSQISSPPSAATATGTTDENSTQSRMTIANII